MRKYLLILLAVVTLGFAGYKAFALTTTMTDLFATGDDGSGGPLFRIDQYGGIHTGSSGDITVTGNDITFGNAETISNSTNGLIKFTDGTNTLFNILDGGSTGSIYFGSASRTIADGSYSISVSTDLATTGDLTVSGNDLTFGNGEAITNATNALVAVTDGTNNLLCIADDGTTGSIYFGSSSRNIKDGTYAIAVSTDLTVTGPVLTSAGKYGMTDAVGNTYYEVALTSSVAGGGVATLSAADGKAGWFSVIMGSHCASGSFTTSAVVTLTTECSADTSTTNDNAQTLNIYDGGSVVKIENNVAGTTKTMYIKYGYVN